VTSVHRVLGVLGDVLVTLGVLLLLFVVWQLWWTDVTANGVQRQTVQSLSREFTGGGGRAGSPSDPGTGAGSAPVVPGEAFAIVRIPRLGADYARPVLEGTDRDTLQRGLGHYRGTALPGAVGNFAVAGHRTTYGRPFHDIDRLEPGDTIVVETRTGYSVYAVRRHEIVTPDDVAVIAPVPDHPGARPTGSWMTLTACHPKYSAARRYIVLAELVHTYPYAQGPPAGALSAPTGA
jgi:sortase A